MQVKICGITSVEDGLAASEAGADFIGLIMAETPRRAAPDVARRILDRLPEQTKGVLLFRDQPHDEIVACVRKLGAKFVQLHGRESPEFIGELKAALPEVRFIRAWPLASQASLAALLDHIKCAARIGVDFYRVIVDQPKSGPPPSEGIFKLAAGGWSDDLPGLWRAGGLTAHNVAETLRETRYVGVDVARGVETSPGTKDRDAMRAFIQAAKRPPACR